MSTQIERSTATRAKILTVARIAFVRDGYDGASLERIAAEAGLTKGALYHHYDGKKALFAALFGVVSQETAEKAGKAATGSTSPRDRLKAAAMAWLDAVERGDARTILLELGPGALGFADARAIEDSITLKPLSGLVQAAIDAEQLAESVNAVLAARLINAALAEIAMLRHATGGRSPDIDECALAIAGIIDGVLQSR